MPFKTSGHDFAEMMRQANAMPGASGASPSPSSKSGGSSRASGGQEAESSRMFIAALLLMTLMSVLMSLAAVYEPNRWLHNDGSFYMNTVRSLLESHTLRQEAFHPHTWYEQRRNLDAAWSNIALGRNGEWWPKHPILMPICALPFVWAMGPFGALVFQVTGLLLCALLTYLIAAKAAPRPMALCASLLLFTTGWLTGDAFGFSNDIFYTVLVLAAVERTLSMRALSAGLFLGFAIFAKPTNVLYAPALIAVFALNRQWKLILKFALGAFFPCLALAASNWYLYGAPWNTGYDVTLVRENGVLTTHSHRADFNFTFEGLKNGLFGVFFGRTQSFQKNFPAFFAALLGIVLLCVRRPKIGLPFLWMIAVPIVFHAPFRWFRIDFCLPAACLAITPLAALLSFGKAPYAEPFRPSRINWGRLAPLVIALVLLIAAGVHHFAAFRGDLLWENIKTAKVLQGSQRCDYFNNQMERWECSGGDAAMTGRALSGLSFGQKKEKILLAAPTGSSEPKVLTFPALPLKKKLVIRAGIADGPTKAPGASLEIIIGGESVLRPSPLKRGALTTFDVSTASWAGKTAEVTFRITTSARKFRPEEIPVGLSATAED